MPGAWEAPVIDTEEARVAASGLRRAIALVAAITASAAIMGVGQPQALPDIPNVFSGSVTIAGEPAPDGVEIFARLGSYQSNVPRPGFEANERSIVLTEGGRYESLKVQPPGSNNVGRTISFYATYGSGDVQAEETISFRPGPIFVSNYDLTFTELPPGEPQPTPGGTTEAATAEPEPTSAEPTPPPSPSPTPVLPIPGDPNIPRISQLALVLGAAAIIAGGAALLALRRRKVL